MICPTASDSTFDEPATVEKYDNVLSQVTRPDFLSSGQFLLDLGEHELMSTLCAHINGPACHTSHTPTWKQDYSMHWTGLHARLFLA
jgi:hypothetical protein